MKLKKKFGEISQHLEQGAEFVFDEKSYSQFLLLSKSANLKLGSEIFTEISIGKLQFVQINISNS